MYEEKAIFLYSNGLSMAYIQVIPEFDPSKNKE